MTRLPDVVPPVVRFGTESDFQLEVATLLSATRGSPVTLHPLGESEEGRPIMGYLIGSGSQVVSLVAGAHSDEPVGPETLRALLRAFILAPERYVPYLEAFTFAIIPHVNPDGEERNRSWIRSWPNLDTYLRQAFREPPGRDVEFGYPSMRIENELFSRFIADRGPVDLHVSLHGMGFSDGALLLIERGWIDRTVDLREGFTRLAFENGLKLHDHDRKGEKGFEHIGPGFTTTPRGAAMRAHFEALGDTGTAALFHDSSMEWVSGLGGDPLALVTELPLFVIRSAPPDEPPGVPQTYLDLKASLADARLEAERVGDGAAGRRHLERFDLAEIPLVQAMRMQLSVIDLGLEAITATS